MTHINLACRMALAANLLAFLTFGAEAHITLEQQQAAVGAAYKGVLRVPHGCGAAPTIRVRLQIPEGLVNVKPMPKPGWTLETIRKPYGKVYELQHAKVSEGVREVSWSGGNLPNDWYDEFVFTGQIASDLSPGQTLYFPAVQECEGGGAERWIEIPAAGGSARDLKSPAPGLKVVAPAPTAP